ncbi:ornithine decarboxylase [Arboricoccus pini]|uniref:ornithine decarboxylase n=1 Tax=Arboricoccus pini TaxID=1963835 RepID=A0A212PZ61_9PROT|nr:type III PLP-dependent enzyme [Arboricoccus pini]SNB52401.1 ornithine decarboxylase [Arboricoccus pini]
MTTTTKLDRFMQDVRPATPYLVVDLDIVEANYRALAEALPDARIYYAVKANPAPEVLHRLAALGSSFDVASVPEVELALATGVNPSSLSFGNTIKKERDIARAFELGVRLFAFDSEAELLKIARAAPGAKVFCRILTSGEGAEWPLSKKFGCTPDMAFELMKMAATLPVVPHGISFHVGSQQRDPGQWDAAVASAALLFRRLEEKAGIELKMVNLGGGFPALYREAVPAAAAYGAAIWDSLRRHFGNRIPAVIAEPGRGLVGDAGVIEAEVVLIAEKGDAAGRRWIYLDVGKFGGLAETMDEAIRYPIETDRDGTASPVILAGPTCDSADVLYEKNAYLMPDSLAIGDRVRIKSTGAYTTSYSAVNFNGFEPLRAYFV